jgi:hypothetical protein
MADQKERPNGLVVADDGGNYYYLRPEILAQAKMPEAEVLRMKAGLAEGKKGQDRELSVDDLQGVAGGASPQLGHLPGVHSIGNISSLKMPTGPDLRGADMRGMTSTIMCPW